ncbi:MAG: FAD-dependent monooxygenase [Clostridiales bacterium]|nr:FAD-dependent monooxygenase [Clostridiales bacterium]MCF8022898.1 FAD-dependent monooxygenase [Clostridiales bacterium]
MKYDVIIIGAGPGGCIAAQKLAEKGVKIILVEQKNLPRHKTCAGAVSGKALPFLEDNFYYHAEDKMTHLVFRYNYGEGVGYHAGKPFAYTITRDKFDYYLARRAAAAPSLIYIIYKSIMFR